MTHGNLAFRRALVICSCVAAVSCGGPSAHKVVPDLDGLQIVTVEKTLQVVPVTGVKGWLLTFENDKFADALAQTLTKSRLFARVSKSQSGDYLLKAHIATQGAMGFGDVDAVFVVRYSLKTASGQEVFQKEIVTGCQKTGSDHFVGRTRGNAALECAVQGNLNKLIRELARAIGDRSARLDLHR